MQKGFAHPFLIGIILLVLTLLAVGFFLFKDQFLSKSSIPSSTQTVAEPTVELKTEYENPFDEKTQYQNPFAESDNPFDNLR